MGCPLATSGCPAGYSGPRCKTEAPWLSLAYGFDVDPDAPYFIRKTSKLFDISSDDVDVTPTDYADGKIVYSTSETTIAEHMAAKMGVAGYFGAFSAAASMAVSTSAESSIKTVRLDALVRINRQRAMTAGAFRTQPHTRLDPSLKAFIDDVPLTCRISRRCWASFYARSANLGGVVQKTYTMQATASDTQASVETALRAGRGNWFIGGEGSFTDSQTKRTDVEGALMSTRFHAEGGDTRLWLAVDGRGTNFEEVKQRWASSFAADGHDLYPWGLELRPIWEVVERIDATKGKALKDYLMQKWQRQARAFSPVNFYTPIPRAVEIRGAAKRSWAELNGIYTRVDGKLCNGKPVYQTPGTWPAQDCVLYQPNGDSGWFVSDTEDAESCKRRGWIRTQGLVCDERPDCAGRWLESEGCAWGEEWCDAHRFAVRETECSEVCGAHGSVVANAVMCKCACRDGFSGPRCDVPPWPPLPPPPPPPPPRPPLPPPRPPLPPPPPLPPSPPPFKTKYWYCGSDPPKFVRDYVISDYAPLKPTMCYSTSHSPSGDEDARFWQTEEECSCGATSAHATSATPGGEAAAAHTARAARAAVAVAHQLTCSTCTAMWGLGHCATC